MKDQSSKQEQKIRKANNKANVLPLTDLCHIVPRELFTQIIFKIIYRSTNLNDVDFGGRLSSQVRETVYRLKNQCRPGGHISGNHKNDSAKILQKIFVPDANSMCFSRLKFSLKESRAKATIKLIIWKIDFEVIVFQFVDTYINSIQFNDYRTVYETEAKLSKPRFDETIQRFWFKVTYNNLEKRENKLNQKRDGNKQQQRMRKKLIRQNKQIKIKVKLKFNCLYTLYSASRSKKISLVYLCVNLFSTQKKELFPV